MSRTRVKICGITRLEDAITACAEGADALGFVFYKKSPRYINPKAAATIIQSLPAFITTVGLFVDENADQVKTIIALTQLDLLQFHGNESKSYCELFNRPYIKAIRIHKKHQLEDAAFNYPTAKAILVDAYKPGVPGGTGETFDWELLPKNNDFPFILAGGLTSLNVAEAIQKTNAYAVDVSGGVELDKGIKSADKIAQFFKEVRKFEPI
jgi:phosphoribosylanthranilate isomerase